jgi:hypothetical protein
VGGPRELGERGLSEALERLRDRLPAGVGYDVPQCECLFWIYGLSDVQKGVIDKATDAGKTVRALTWARNYAAHQLMSAANPNYAASGIFGMGVQGMGITGAGPGPLIWTAEGDLPPSRDEVNKGRPDARRKLYEQFVEGCGVLDPLVTVQSYLASLL